MAQWIAAFLGENARENYEITRATGDFWVTSSRTPIRKSTSGDKVLLYISEEGFVGDVEAATGARAPYGGAKWAGGIPAQGISLRGIRRFTSPVLYKFPRKGPHPTLGFIRSRLPADSLISPKKDCKTCSFRPLRVMESQAA